jgi:hypothetical protein
MKKFEAPSEQLKRKMSSSKSFSSSSCSSSNIKAYSSIPCHGYNSADERHDDNVERLQKNYTTEINSKDDCDFDEDEDENDNEEVEDEYIDGNTDKDI